MHLNSDSKHDAVDSDATVAKTLVGNKCDLENIRNISVDEGKSPAEAEGLFFIETSALDSTTLRLSSRTCIITSAGRL
ncbi:unnamed protein product [Musa hybrid cultivar]